METYQDYFRLAQLKLAYEKALRSYGRMGFLARILKKKPVDPAPGRSSGNLLRNFRKAANRACFSGTPGAAHSGDAFAVIHDDGTYILANASWAQEDGLPVVTCRYHDGVGFFEERKHITPSGEPEEWGIRYPYSECGVTGLPDRHGMRLPREFQPMADAFRRAVDLMSGLVRANRDLIGR